jgi:hypothetical protein
MYTLNINLFLLTNCGYSSNCDRLPVREGHVEQLLPDEPDEPHRPTEARQRPQLRGHPPGHTELQEQAGQGEQAEQGCV